jgi:sterol desaturase/sphingolipid hydroxylase (fatty acid hydroxylase superfamily)
MVQYFTEHAHTLLIDLLRVCAWLTILSAIFVPLERLFALHREKIFRAEFGSDLALYFINGLVPAALLSVPLGLAGGAVHFLIPAGFHAAVGGMSFWARLPMALVVGETGYYWGHRMMHEVPALWRFHSVHHSARHIDYLVSSRAHPVDIVFGRLCGTIPLYILGLAGPAGAAEGSLPMLIVLGGTIWGFFVHANLRWRLGPLEWLVTSPAFHHWHHTLAEPTNRNYASTLPWLDRIFGTFHHPKGQWPTSYGIKETMPESLGGQLVDPLLEPHPWPVVRSLG